jgi:hypothetical protein
MTTWSRCFTSPFALNSILPRIVSNGWPFITAATLSASVVPAFVMAVKRTLAAS